MRRHLKLQVGALAMGAALCAPPVGLVNASSHREAPFITKNPKVDASDFYAFNSYDPARAGYVTLIANYQPLQDPAGGPNFYSMDPDALYEIHIDNDADGKEDLTFQFQFSNTLNSGGTGQTLPIGPSATPVAIPIVNFGAITASDQSKLNLAESYTVNLVTGPRRTGVVTPVYKTGTQDGKFTKPLDNVGAATFADYAGYASQYNYQVDINGCTPTAGKARVFVGQRADGFEVNLGTIFDLVGAPGALGTVAGGTTRATRGDDATDTLQSSHNSLAHKNVTTIALEIPAACLTKGTQTIIGAWTTSSVRQARVINPAGGFTTASKEGGAWAQVSRLGMPLVNEVIIGIKDKDLFNASEPSGDAQYLAYVDTPVLPDYLQLLYGAAAAKQLAPKGTSFPRKDLEGAFLKGFSAVDTGAGATTSGKTVNVNQNGSTAEYLRLNTALGSTIRTKQSSLGAAACFVNGALKLDNTDGTVDGTCDPAGFPNGRRPGDDVVDIELRVAMGSLLPQDATNNPNPTIPYTDYAPNYDTQFGTTFPYLNTPYAGE